MAKRQGQVCGRIFHYAIASGKSDSDPVPSMRGAFKPGVNGDHAAISANELPYPASLREVDGRMFVPTKVMFRRMMMTFVRTSELTETPWSAIQENPSWLIGRRRMKMGKKKLDPCKANHHAFLQTQGWARRRGF